MYIVLREVTIGIEQALNRRPAFAHEVEDEWSSIAWDGVKREGDARSVLSAAHNVLSCSPWPPPTASATAPHLFLTVMFFFSASSYRRRCKTSLY